MEEKTLKTKNLKLLSLRVPSMDGPGSPTRSWSLAVNQDAIGSIPIPGV